MARKSKKKLNHTDNTKPHVVKFSGGRSSGMMLFQLLRQKSLKPERGDVIVFNNTSAEHPATYEFTRQMKTLAEDKYNIPFFWIEFDTFEDSSRLGWRRNPTYKLVNDQPFNTRNRNGYHAKGEIFESMVSFKGFLPNMHTRICTQQLKIFITNSFLSDWFGQTKGIKRLGHHGKKARQTDNGLVDTYKKNRGKVPQQIILDKRKYVRKTNFTRKAAKWQDYTNAKLAFDNPAIKEVVVGSKAPLFGSNAVAYVSYLGIRKDEEIRVDKIRARIKAEKQSKELSFSFTEQPPKEEILAPLVEQGKTQMDVIKFWRRQRFNLALPDTGNYSNCVYCPLKGKSKLLEIATAELLQGDVPTNSPASINWWINMEKKYSRDLVAEKTTIRSKKSIRYIGFFGAAKEPVYRQIKQEARKNGKDITKPSKTNKTTKAEFLEEEDYVPCSCTD